MTNLIKRSFVGIMFLFFFFSCSIYQKKRHANACVINYEESDFILTKQDSALLSKIYASNIKFADSCRKYNLDCLYPVVLNEAHFKGGFDRFRKLFSDNFKIPKKIIHNTKYTTFITIGKDGDIKSFKILNTKKDKLHKEISRTLSLKELNHWKPANFRGYPCEYGIKINFTFIKK